MSWQQWLLVGIHAGSALGTIWMIDKERQPITPTVAMFSTIVSAAFIWLVVSI